MIPLVTISALLLALTGLFAWAIWHLLNDEKRFPKQTLTAKRHNLSDPDDPDLLQEPKSTEPISISEMGVPPNYTFMNKRFSPMLSGMGSNWSLLRRLSSVRRNRRYRVK